VNDIKIIDFPVINDNRGDLTFLQKDSGLPFEIKRVFWTYDLKTHSKRGGHAYKTQNEIISVVSGSANIKVTYKNGIKKEFVLNQASKGIFIPANIWRQIENFATNTILLHISDSMYDENNYIRDLDKYLENE
jgi:dTDP-4-dehydrorhamnose 3,5-epimerase-like enzyme